MTLPLPKHVDRLHTVDDDSTHQRFQAVTQLLEQALTAVRELPEAEQDAIAALILDELADEKRWDAAFARSQDKLAEMAVKARADVQSGRVRSGGFEEL
jgi:hypothetical protein